MSTMTNQVSTHLTEAAAMVPTGAATLTSDAPHQRLAEAAAYAVLRRMAPVLRHDVVGLMQPVGIVMTLLQKRIQTPEPDLQAIAKNLASASAMTKEASIGCANAIGWITSNEDPLVNLRTCMDEAAQLMSMELSAAGLKIDNGISDDTTVIPQSFFRSVLIGALLAFCDHQTASGSLQVTLEAGPKNTDKPQHLWLRILPNNTDQAAISIDSIRKYRNIDWTDVQALAGLFNVTTSQSDGWLTLDLADMS
jgi:hypothetical protein